MSLVNRAQTNPQLFHTGAILRCLHGLASAGVTKNIFGRNPQHYVLEPVEMDKWRPTESQRPRRRGVASAPHQTNDRSAARMSAIAVGQPTMPSPRSSGAPRAG